MAEYIESICRRCFHSYVCGQFNEHRNSSNEKCHFFNDHFVSAADVAPVVHGKWIYNAKWRGWECSVCGCNVDTLRKFPYCHGCGARMDGDD